MTQKEIIDFVVPWVDCNDSEWIKLYHHYRCTEEHVEDEARYRNWDIFKYWFRAVEQYAPWVNKVFLVTNGTFPKFINPNHPKLVLINHLDYIPSKFLPTFNANTIELNIFRIKELSERFVYFNDDFFINAPISPNYYFRDGLPCDNNEEQLFPPLSYSKNNQFGISIMELMDVSVVNGFYKRRDSVKSKPKNWYGFHLGFKGLCKSLVMMRKERFQGFVMRHYEQPYLKSILNEVWEKAEQPLLNSCTQFRQYSNLNQYVFRYWQLASNRFYPVRLSGEVFQLGVDDLHQAINALYNDNIKSLCLNDTPLCDNDRFLKESQLLREAFERKFPQKSSFEL